MASLRNRRAGIGAKLLRKMGIGGDLMEARVKATESGAVRSADFSLNVKK